MLGIIAFYFIFFLVFTVFSYVGVFQLRKTSHLDFISEGIIRLYRNMAIIVIILTFAAIISEYYYYGSIA